ncbi:hypothetical protein P775_21245 [Puniceibacterium antarcticum]|uniref:Uncharacterized protein n=1 Tax=Puniceibacterium antarcticum TaxID=1206336 RepID=A0A2G8R9G0_9RHOB|nr:plasmid replication protein RepC [Puniceibacterium antarcticum]PIL18174.1 hypothetical protein P775_21245 [Puniceibacterium antarcticum]
MEYTPISPFKRRITHDHLRVIETPEASLPGKPINKWELLRELSKAQAAFGITERDLTVLQGLLSFFPHDALEHGAKMVVFPSNKAICDRLNGMPCSTMRRYLARLVDAGLFLRRDSPNGKRYSRKHGDERIAFGFDLTPLYARAEEIARAAEAVRETEERVRRLREIVSLMRRDLAALVEFGEEMQPGLGLWDRMRDAAALTARALRRKLSPDELEQYRCELEALLDEARTTIDGHETEELVTSDAQDERHHQNTNKESIDSESHLGKAKPVLVARDGKPRNAEECAVEPDTRRIPKIPLQLVVSGCPSLKTFYQGEIRHWHQLFDAACHVRPAMGIGIDVWEDAQCAMGPEQASIALAAMLERFTEIRSPGGYLRALAKKALAGEFSSTPMVMALIGRRNAA